MNYQAIDNLYFLYLFSVESFDNWLNDQDTVCLSVLRENVYATLYEHSRETQQNAKM